MNWLAVLRFVGTLLLGVGGTAGAVLPAHYDQVHEVQREHRDAVQEATGYKDAFETVLKRLEECRRQGDGYSSPPEAESRDGR